MIIISFVGWLIQKVQKALLQSDVQSKSDKSPVTVTDYGSQAVVSLLLQRELSSEPFSLVAEEANKNFMTQRIYARMVLRIFSSASLNSSTTLWLLRIYSNPLTLLYQQMIFSEPLTVA
ncbi:3'(2'),5'-bisphosphate nucleotidase-like isoform X2 [Brassica napus]|uniref:3'(2'),5'-bisphosphate nucleotidase-like isoform X2 n=1 Tax=Brassica napus TaxID=3708 RepID=UPI002078F81C|nr:3'(2'),5'-bisphosphate nucleotidase-like isoform X2 [Brassica napus]